MMFSGLILLAMSDFLAWVLVRGRKADVCEYVWRVLGCLSVLEGGMKRKDKEKGASFLLYTQDIHRRESETLSKRLKGLKPNETDMSYRSCHIFVVLAPCGRV